MAYASLDGCQRYDHVNQGMGFYIRSYENWVQDTGGCTRQFLFNLGGAHGVFKALTRWTIQNEYSFIHAPDPRIGSNYSYLKYRGGSLLTNRITGLQLLGTVDPWTLTPESVTAFEIFNEYIEQSNANFFSHGLYTALLQVERGHINDNFIEACRAIFHAVQGERFGSSPLYIDSTVRDIGRLHPEFVNNEFTDFATAILSSIPETVHIESEAVATAVRVACMVDAADRHNFLTDYQNQAQGKGRACARAYHMEKLLDRFYLPQDFDPLAFLALYPEVERAQDELKLTPEEFGRRLYLREGRRAGWAYKAETVERND